MPRRSCCRHNSTRTRARDELPAIQVLAAELARPGCALVRGVPVRRRVCASSSFPIANSAPERERNLDPGQWHADITERFAVVLPDPPKHTKDHALAQNPY